MNYILYGSKPSPFTRRIRMVLGDLPHEFKELDIYNGVADATELTRINPVNQIPVLKDGDNTIWDSRQIFNYLNARHRFQNIDWQDENILTAIDGAMNSAVSLLLMKRSGIDITQNLMYPDRQKNRIELILDFLKPTIKDHCLKTWDFHTMSLYSFLDWGLFRGVINIDKRPECQHLLELYKTKPVVIQTEIPKA